MAAGHYTYLDHIIPQVSEFDANKQKFVMAAIVAVGLVVLGKALTSRLKNKQGVEQSLIPTERVSLFGFFDLFVEVFVKYQDSVLGKEYRKHAPFCASIFLFLFVSNVIGLIPGMPAITTTVWVNVGMALAVFFYFNILGVMSNGVLGYLKHFWGPSLLLGFMLFPIEILSTCLRILTLNLRLYWNISADHEVLSTLTGLLPTGFAFPVYFLGLFVSFMQAFIFTTLTMIYILLASAHEEDH